MRQAQFMQSGAVLAFLVAAGSGLCWLPFCREPNLDLSQWIALAVSSLCSGLAASFNPTGWLWFPFAAFAGTLGGLCFCEITWPPSDPIARPWVPFLVAAVTLIAVIGSLAASLIGRKMAIPPGAARVTGWVILAGCLAFGPVTLWVTPPLVAYRVRRNDQIAAERFAALKNAVEMATAANPASVCDESELRRHYAGPPFSGDEWQRITGNYVKEDGYMFMVYCHEKNGYTIDAHPGRQLGDGTRQFCTNELKKIDCRMEWNRSRHACLPCNKQAS